MKYKLPSEVGLARTVHQKRPRKKPEPALRKWLTKSEARALGYTIP